MKVRRFKSGLLVEGTKEEIDKIIKAKPITNEFLEECKAASKLFIKERIQNEQAIFKDKL